MPDDLHVKSMPVEMSQSIAHLRQKFIDQLEQRILDIEASLVDFRKNKSRMTSANTIGLHSHNIAGLASSLGFGAIGAAAAEADRAWGYAIKASLSPSAQAPAIESVERLLDLLEEALEP